MGQELLSAWLDVPPSPWPPNHYALLGLAPGQADTDEIEQRVLERMESLRRYQLTHPEPVTEGMNLLAQAMICLTDPAARREYDRSLGVTSAPADARAPSRSEPAQEEAAVIDLPPPTEFVYSEDLEEPPVREPLPDAIIPELVEEPLPLPDEEDDEERDEEFDDEEPLELPLVDDEDWAEPSEPTPHDQRQYRRGIYGELVRIRRVLEIWGRLRNYLDEPEKAFTRRTETVAFMTCLSDLRPLLGTVHNLIGEAGQPGHLVAVLSRQQLVVEMFRSLLPSQREALSQDCRSAHYVLLDRYDDLRDEVRRLTAKGFSRRVWRPLMRHLVARPEWFLLMIGMAALAIAFLRSMPQ
jgi:hypothetical protein